MNKASLLTATAAIIAGWASTASALDFPSGFYVGGGLGFSRLSDSVCDQLPGTIGAQLRCDEQDVAWKVYAGWQPIRWVGVEAGYLDLGETTASGGITNLKAQADGGTLALTFTAPYIERIGLYGKVGAFFWDGELSGKLFGTDIGSVTADDTSTFLGIGLRYPFGDHFGVGVEWERYLDIGSTSAGGFEFAGGQVDVDMYTANFIYAF